MDYTKEILLVVATTLVSTGVTVIAIPERMWQGVAILLIGASVFVGRGFYKKFLGNK